MKNKYLSTIVIILMVISLQPIISAFNSYELITYTTEDGGVIEASFFKGNQDLAVIFAHGAIFNKESWYFMAEKLQKENISSLTLDFRGYGNSKSGNTNKRLLDILGAIDYLKEKGFNNIAIVGGSMGGAAILNALDVNIDTIIKKVVLLAPAGGSPIASKAVNKLFVVSKEERLFASVNEIYNESSQPKELKIYPGSFHAQHMFKAEYSNELTNLIINFLNN